MIKPNCIKLFSVLIGTFLVALFFFPHASCAQWQKNGSATIVIWDPDNTVDALSTVTPNGPSGFPSPAESNSVRGDNDADAYAIAKYTVRQVYHWNNTIYGPPSPSFNIEIDVTISGSASPAAANPGPDPDDNTGLAGASSMAGMLTGDCSNLPPPGYMASYVDSRNSVVSLTASSNDMYSAHCDISMRVETSASWVVAGVNPCYRTMLQGSLVGILPNYQELVNARTNSFP